MIELLGNVVPGGNNNLICEHRQDAVLAWTFKPPQLTAEREWFVRVAWDGSAGVACRLVGLEEPADPGSLVGGPIREAWAIASQAVTQLSAVGPAYLRILAEGQQYDPPDDDPAMALVLDTTGPGQLDRGPIGRNVDDELLPGIEREIRRHMGQRAFEGDA